MKKYLFIFLLTLLPMMANADSSGTCGDNLTWTYVEATNTLTISGNGGMSNYGYYNNEAPWYSFRTSISTVVIQNGVTSIGNYAFYHCWMTSVTIPNSVTSIGDYAFSGCKYLTSVAIGNSVTSIGSVAFYDCSSLTSVTIPNSVTSIGSIAFRNCSGLTSVHISDLAAWYNISFYSNESNPLFYAHHLYLNGTEVTDLVIPNSVTSIGEYAFYNCSGLTYVTIPNSVTSIGDYAFSGCNITVLAVLCPTPPTINDIGYSNKIVMVPSGSEEAYANAEGWKNYNIIPYEDPTAIRFKDQNVKDICVEHWDKNGDGELDTWEALCVQDIGTTFMNNTTIMKFDEFKYFKAVTNIPSEAFVGCTNLRAITIPEYVNTISGLYWNLGYHYGPFKDCSSLTSINIPSNITTIGSGAFSGCATLNAVHITDLTAWCNISFNENSEANPLFYAHHLFLNDEEVTDLVIPDGITSINADAFEGASSLTSVSIPEGVTTIGNRAFRGCSGLTSVHISDLAAWCNISFGDYGNPLSSAHHLYLNGTEVTDLIIPDGVTSISSSAFSGCSGLTSVTIGNSVTSIGDYAFSSCDNMVLTVLNPTPPTINNIGYNKIVMVPEGCEEAYANADGWKNLRIIPYEEPSIISFKDQNAKDFCVEHWDHNGDGELDTWEAMSVADIGTTFQNNATIMKFDEFKYFKSVTSIPANAFSGCINLRSISIPNSVTSIRNYAFNNCSGLTSVHISDLAAWCNISFDASGNPLSYAHHLYLNGTEVTDLVIPNSVTSIRNYAFYGCSGLTSVTIGNSVTSIGDGAFYNCSGLTSVTIPNSVTSISYFAFSGCSGLTSVHISDLAAWCNISFRNNSFDNAHHLYLNGTEVTDLIIPDGVTSISNYAFYGCSGLTSVTIPNSVTSIGSGVFSGCSGLTAVNITDLGAWCGISFANGNCNPLNQVHHLRLNGEEVTDLTIPEGVTEIGNYAFYGGTGFTSVNIPGTVTNIGSQAFYGCSNISTVAFSEGIQNIGAEAFRNCSNLTTVSLPEGVTTVGDNAFNTGSMKNVTIPSTLYSFGNTAFGNGLRSVAVTTDEPPLIGENAFPNRTNALLVVPQGSTAAYQEEMYWQDFKAILEYPGGDVNADGDTNMVDVVDIVRFVVGTPSDMFIEVMADLNNSKSVNVADAMVLVNEIVGDMNYAKPMWAPAMTNDVLALAGDGNRLSLLMEGNGQYAAFQCDLWLPEGMDVMDVQLNDSRRQGHQLLYNKVGDGHYRVVAISTAANSFRGTGGELLGLTLDGFATDDIRMDNIHFVTTRGDDIPFDDLGVSNGSMPTTIASPTVEQQGTAIYNLNGQRIAAPQKGVNIVNGKKVTIK